MFSDPQHYLFLSTRAKNKEGDFTDELTSLRIVTFDPVNEACLHVPLPAEHRAVPIAHRNDVIDTRLINEGIISNQCVLCNIHGRYRLLGKIIVTLRAIDMDPSSNIDQNHFQLLDAQ